IASLRDQEDRVYKQEAGWRAPIADGVDRGRTRKPDRDQVQPRPRESAVDARAVRDRHLPRRVRVDDGGGNEDVEVAADAKRKLVEENGIPLGSAAATAGHVPVGPGID